MKTRSQTNSLPKPIEKYVDLPHAPAPAKQPDKSTDEIHGSKRVQ